MVSQPIANAYWVLPGRLLAGEHPFGEDPADAQDRFAALRDAGINSFIDLTEVGERPNYYRLLHRQAEYARFPIADTGVPKDARQMLHIQAGIRAALAKERSIYVHCRAGIGRTGIVIGCFLVDEGMSGNAALKRLNALWRQSARSLSWPKVPQTEEQAEYIRRWPELKNQPDSVSVDLT
jgi:hypothetical protein